MKTALMFLAGIAGLVIIGGGVYYLLYGIVHAVKCEEVVVMTQTRAAQFWEYPVLLLCLLLLVPALSSAYWNEGIIQKLTGKR